MLPAKWRSYAKRCLSNGVESEGGADFADAGEPNSLPTSVFGVVCFFFSVLSTVPLNLAFSLPPPHPQTFSLQTTSSTRAPCVSSVPVHAISYVVSCFSSKKMDYWRKMYKWKNTRKNGINI